MRHRYICPKCGHDTASDLVLEYHECTPRPTPREWWLAGLGNTSSLMSGMCYAHTEKPKQSPDAVHVVEASRLAQAEAERDEWKSEYENLCKFATDLERERDELKRTFIGVEPHDACVISYRELRVLRKERDEWERVVFREREQTNTLLNEKIAYIKQFKADRDRLRAALERIAKDDWSYEERNDANGLRFRDCAREALRGEGGGE